MSETREEYELVTDKQKELAPLFDRMDKDEELYFLKPYEMKQLPPNDSKKVDDVANITLNDPLLFATKAIAIIAGAKRQSIVEGDDLTDKQTTKIEQFTDDLYYMVNEWLVKRGILSLDSFVNEQVCIRGRIAARACISLNGNTIRPAVLPLDARQFVYESDQDGMIWGAPIFRRSKAQIKREYGESVQVGSDFAEVVDFWSAERNIIFVDRRVVKDQPNPYGYPPFVVSVCPIGSSFNTTDAQQHQGESIFWANRAIWEEKNRCATILQTINILSLFAGLQYESTLGTAAPKSEQSPWKPRTVHPVEKGGGFRPMPLGDIKNATRLFYSALETALQRGSLSAVDYGTLTFPLSAVAISTLTASRDDIFLPRIQAIALFYQALTRMVIDQCKGFGRSFRLTNEGKRNTYSSGDFKGEYTIKYRFFTDSKEQATANLSIANAAQNFLSGDTIRREVLKLQDPDGEQAKFLSEQAEKVDEVLFLYRRASSLITEDKPVEAYILAQRIVSVLKQRQAQGTITNVNELKGATPQPEMAKPAEPMPLVGGGRMRTPPQEEGVNANV